MIVCRTNANKSSCICLAEIEMLHGFQASLPPSAQGEHIGLSCNIAEEEHRAAMVCNMFFVCIHG